MRHRHLVRACFDHHWAFDPWFGQNEMIPFLPLHRETYEFKDPDQLLIGDWCNFARCQNITRQRLLTRRQLVDEEAIAPLAARSQLLQALPPMSPWLRTLQE